jgi:hypothetical protein
VEGLARRRAQAQAVGHRGDRHSQGEKRCRLEGHAEQKMVAENEIADLTEGQCVGTLAGIGLHSLGVRDH